MRVLALVSRNPKPNFKRCDVTVYKGVYYTVHSIHVAPDCTLVDGVMRAQIEVTVDGYEILSLEDEAESLAVA